MSLTPFSSRRTVPLTAAIAALALLGAGCGSSSSSSSSTTPSLRGFATAAYQYAGCMRKHGVDLPDPQVVDQPGRQMVMQRIPTGLEKTPQFATAKAACRGILPNPGNISPAQQAAQQQTRRRDLLAFARCLRSHGLPNFPDPTSQGQLSQQMVNAAGVDLHAPAVLPAAKACIGAANGAITGADVERAINGTQ